MRHTGCIALMSLALALPSAAHLTGAECMVGDRQSFDEGRYWYDGWLEPGTYTLLAFTDRAGWVGEYTIAAERGRASWTGGLRVGLVRNRYAVVRPFVEAGSALFFNTSPVDRRG